MGVTASTRCAVVFAAGRAGDPVRHQALLDRISDAGLTVVAPEFAPFPMGRARLGDLQARIDGLDDALAALPASTRIIGVGHSIGATLLLAKAGAHMWAGPGERVRVAPDARIAGLVLLAPPVGYFAAPGALEPLSIPIMLKVGVRDAVTPPASYAGLRLTLEGRLPLDFEVVDGADHFSFMDVRPPDQPEPMAAAETCRQHLADQIIELASQPS